MLKQQVVICFAQLHESIKLERVFHQTVIAVTAFSIRDEDEVPCIWSYIFRLEQCQYKRQQRGPEEKIITS